MRTTASSMQQPAPRRATRLAALCLIHVNSAQIFRKVQVYVALLIQKATTITTESVP